MENAEKFLFQCVSLGLDSVILESPGSLLFLLSFKKHHFISYADELNEDT